MDEAVAPLSVLRAGYAGGFLGRASLSAGTSVFNNAPPHVRSSGISLTPESGRPGETQLQAREVSVGVEATKTINALKIDLASEIQNNKRLQTSLDLAHETLKELRQKITEQDSKILELEYRNQTRNAPSRGHAGMSKKAARLEGQLPQELRTIRPYFQDCQLLAGCILNIVKGTYFGGHGEERVSWIEGVNAVSLGSTYCQSEDFNGRPFIQLSNPMDIVSPVSRNIVGVSYGGPMSPLEVVIRSPMNSLQNCSYVDEIL